MTKYSKYNFVYQLQKWIDSVAGQTFLNYAYSWGAAIVILGTLFKLTHIDGANIMLFIGMGTEVFVFFISAFDRPFDKTAEGRELPLDYRMAPYKAAAMAACGPIESRVQEIKEMCKSLGDDDKIKDITNELNSFCANYKENFNELTRLVNDNKSTHESIKGELSLMEQNLKVLNGIYGRMIEAIEINR